MSLLPRPPEDIHFELLYLRQVAERHGTRAIRAPLAAALRECELWVDPVISAPRRANLWRALALAGLIATMPVGWLPVQAAPALRVELSVIDATTGKALPGAEVHGEKGELIGKVGPNGKLVVDVPAGATDRLVIVKPGYRSQVVVRVQLGSRTLIPLEPAPSPPPSESPTPVARVKATPAPAQTPKPTPAATPRPTPKPTPEATPTPKATPKLTRVAPTPKPTPLATPKPTPRPTPEATPTPKPTPKLTRVTPAPKPTHKPSHAAPIALPELKHPSPTLAPSPEPIEEPIVAPTEAPPPEAPPSAAPATPAPSARAARTYVVRSGDSLWAIARREFGDGNRWHVLFDANHPPIQRADRIFPGMVLHLPAAEALARAPHGGQVIVVKRGDSLWKLAAQHLGNGERWRALYRANRKLVHDPRLIRPGWVLRLP